MKLVIAIVQKEDSSAVTRSLVENGFSSTWLSTSGGFLGARNATMLAGVEEDRLAELIEIVKACCHSRTKIITAAPFGMDREFPAGMPVEVRDGGAVIFVMDVEQYLRV